MHYMCQNGHTCLCKSFKVHIFMSDVRHQNTVNNKWFEYMASANDKSADMTFSNSHDGLCPTPR